MNQTMRTTQAPDFAIPQTGKSSDVVKRVEATLDQIDTLWADLDRGDFQLDIEKSEKPNNLTTDRPADCVPPAMSPKQVRAMIDYTVSIVIPVFNERKTILQVIDQVRQLPFKKEIIVVDDYSTDGTRGWLETLRGTPDVRLIFQEQNCGKGAALQTGFAAATGEIVIVQDADLEYDPKDIPAVIRPIVTGRADVAYGSRYLEGCGRDGSRLHRMGNWLLTSLSNCLNGVRLTDMETCYKAFRRSVLQEIELKQRRFGFEPEITAKIARRQYRIQEVPVGYAPRDYAQGKKIGVKDLLSTLFCIVRYGWAD